jgi:hypothetical protein
MKNPGSLGDDKEVPKGKLTKNDMNSPGNLGDDKKVSKDKLTENDKKEVERILNEANKDSISFFHLSKHKKDFDFISENWKNIEKDELLADKFQPIVKKYLFSLGEISKEDLDNNENQVTINYNNGDGLIILTYKGYTLHNSNEGDNRNVEIIKRLAEIFEKIDKV